MENERPEQYLILTDAWRNIKIYVNAPELNDEGWDELIKVFNDFYEKYNNEFAKEIALACLNEIERIYKENKHEISSRQSNAESK